MAPLPPIPVDDPFFPAEFLNTKAIYEMHQGLPRAGRSNNILPLLIGPKEQGKDYVVGVVWITVFIFLVFFVWSLLLLASKCWCRQNAGFFSGTPPMKPKPPQGYQLPERKKLARNNHAPSRNQNEHMSTGSATNDLDAISLSDGPLSIGAFAEDQSNAKISCSESTEQPKSEDQNVAHMQQGPCAGTNEEVNGHSMVVDYNGSPFESQLNNQQEIDEYENELKKVHCLLSTTRLVVLVAGTVVITFSILFIVQGVRGLGAAVHNGILGLEKIQVIIEDGIALCNSFIEQQYRLSGYFSEIYANLNSYGWCPKLRDHFIDDCYNKTNSILSLGNHTYSTFTNETCTIIMGIPLEEKLDTIEFLVKQLRVAVLNESDNLLSDLLELSGITEDLQRSLQSFQWAFWTSVVFAIFLDLLVVFLLLGVVLAWKQRLTNPFKLARSRYVVPIFIFVTFLVWLFATISCIAAVMGADFCFDAPDHNLIAILGANKDRFSSIVINLSIYYLSGCPPALSPKQVVTGKEGVSLALQALLAVHELVDTAQELNETEFMETCGTSVSPLTAAADWLDDQFHLGLDVLIDTQKLFWCSNVNPVYETVAYNAICYEAVSGLFRMYVSLFIIVCSSMVMITFRAAWQEEVDVPDDLFLSEESTSGPPIGGPQSVSSELSSPLNQVGDHDAQQMFLSMDIDHDEEKSANVPSSTNISNDQEYVVATYSSEAFSAQWPQLAGTSDIQDKQSPSTAMADDKK